MCQEKNCNHHASSKYERKLKSRGSPLPTRFRKSSEHERAYQSKMTALKKLQVATAKPQKGCFKTEFQK